MPDAVETTIVDLLLGRLVGYASAQALPVAWPNRPFTPPAGAYLQADLLWNRNDNPGIADDSGTERRGIFQVTVVAPARAGIRTALNLAGGVVAHYERGTQLVSGGVAVKIAGKPSLGPAPQDADRLRLPVSIRFYSIE